MLELPDDDDLDARAVDFLSTAPPLNVARMVAGTGVAPEFYALLGKLFDADWFPPYDREVIVFRTCRNNSATYPIPQHRVFGGLSTDIVDAILDDDLDHLDDWTRRLCEITDELATTGTLGDAATDDLTKRYGDAAGASKAVLLLAWFQMLTRFVNATGVQAESNEVLEAVTNPASNA